MHSSLGTSKGEESSLEPQPRTLRRSLQQTEYSQRCDSMMKLYFTTTHSIGGDFLKPFLLRSEKSYFNKRHRTDVNVVNLHPQKDEPCELIRVV